MRHALVWGRRAYSKNALNQHDEAIEDYTKAIELGYPEISHAYHNRGFSYLELGQYSNTN
ncbi:MAG: hypothetical protein ACKPGN_20845 [Dolichospermum sp.]